MADSSTALGRDRRAFWTPLALVIISGSWLLWRLDSESLHVDESRQIQPYIDGVFAAASQSVEQGQPPLDAVIGAVFTFVLGPSVFAVRLPSVLWGIAAVLMTYAIARKWTSRPVSLISALVLLANPVFLFYSQYARPYAVALAFFLALLAAILSKAFWSLPVAMGIIGILPWIRVIEGSIGAVLGSLFLAWIMYSNPRSAPDEKVRSAPSRLLIVSATFTLAIVSSASSLLLLLESGGESYVDPGVSHVPMSLAVSAWEMGRDFGLGLWLWVFLIAAIGVLTLLAEVRLRLTALMIALMPAFSLLVIAAGSNIALYERYQYFATPILSLLPILLADVLARRDMKSRQVVPMISGVGLVALMGLESMSVQQRIDFIPYASIARAQDAESHPYLVTSDYVIYEAANTSPDFQDVPKSEIPWLSEYVSSGGIAPASLIVIPPIHVLDLRIVEESLKDFPGGFRIVALKDSSPQSLLDLSHQFEKGAAMRLSHAALRRAVEIKDGPSIAAARERMCDLYVMDAWQQAKDDTDTLLDRFRLSRC